MVVVSAAVGASSAMAAINLLTKNLPSEVIDATTTPSTESSINVEPSISPSPEAEASVLPLPSPDLVTLRFLLQQRVQNQLNDLTYLFRFNDANARVERISQNGKYFEVRYSLGMTTNNAASSGIVGVLYKVQCKYKIVLDRNASFLKFADGATEYSYPNPNWREDGVFDPLWNPEVLWDTVQGTSAPFRDGGFSACLEVIQ